MSPEVRGGDWQKHRTRWTRTLTREIAKGWREIPAPAMRVDHNAKVGPPDPSVRATIADIRAVKVTLAALQATIADLEAQLANAGIPQETLDLAASVRALAEQAAAELPTVPAP